MFHLKQHNLSEEQIILLNDYINKIILPESTYVTDDEFGDAKFSSIFQKNTVYTILTTKKRIIDQKSTSINRNKKWLHQFTINTK